MKTAIFRDSTFWNCLSIFVIPPFFFLAKFTYVVYFCILGRKNKKQKTIPIGAFVILVCPVSTESWRLPATLTTDVG